jgi:hypothetical protein
METPINYAKRILFNMYLFCAFIFILSFQVLEASGQRISHEKDNGIVTIQSGDGQLMFRLKYNDGCYLDRVEVRGQQVIATEKGVSSAIKVNGKWYSSLDKNKQPIVKVYGNSVSIEHIRYGTDDFYVEESWHMTALDDAIEWQIQRQTKGVDVLEDAASTEWIFPDMQMWTGALLDNGCVAWNRLLENKKMTYGSHAGKVLFWNGSDDRCLEIEPIGLGEQHIATRFSHNPDDTHSFVHTVSDSELETRVNLSRFLRDSQLLWKPFSVNSDTKTVTYRISASGYKNRFDLGEFNGVDEDAVREILNTITRYGVIDSKLCGSNGWRSGYACLHEQWFAQMAMAIQDEGYTQNVSDTYNHYRDHAIQPDGRVLARFKDNNLDQMEGTYTKHGFYEAEWGYLLDSQPDYVMVVAEQFHNTGDLEWVRGQKEACENALEYMLKRDSDGDGLMEMINESHKDEQGSDWIDIVWASHENALVNAEMYGAMILWAEVETILGDQEKADRYLKAAKKLKESFNKDIKDGGFWNPEKNWYIYWREKDNTTYGNNLVIPVNFCAVGYGICDDETRKAKLLEGLETEMLKEDLFSWPLCIFPYQAKEVWVKHNYPFPKFENGDIFLAWVELGTRSYANYNPGIAIKYINRIIEQYKKDGLAHQRYARVSQTGLGNDILAGNGMAIMGLYRNIYGIQPKYNRLYLEPHITEALNNTTVKYKLRNTNYQIVLKTDQYKLSANNFTIEADKPFGMDTDAKRLKYYKGKSSKPKLSIETTDTSNLHVGILEESKGLPTWTLQSEKAQRLTQIVYGLNAGQKYRIKSGAEIVKEIVANKNGSLSFSLNLPPQQKRVIKLIAVGID